jgi:hypothetical protein
VQRYGRSDGVGQQIDTVQAQVIKQASDIGGHVGGAIRACIMGLVALSMAAEVQTNDLKPARHEFLGPSERGIVRPKIDRCAVQENQRPTVSTNLKVQTYVSVLEGWQRAPFRRNLERASLHQLSRSQNGSYGANQARAPDDRNWPICHLALATHSGHFAAFRASAQGILLVISSYMERSKDLLVQMD